MTYVLDIKTRFIPETQRIFIVFPGAGYKFFNEMRERSVVFLDIPGFPLPIASDDWRNPKIKDDFVHRLTLSERIKAWHIAGRPDDNQPPRSLEDIGQLRRTARKVQFSGLIKNFYYGLRKGDIVIVPGKDFDDEVLFGEIIDESFASSIEIKRYPGEKVPVRKVKWIVGVPREKVFTWLARKIPTPNPVRQVETSYFSDVFDVMYQRYFFRDEFVCQYSVGSKDFSTLDNFLFQQIVLYIAALYENNHDGGIKNIDKETIASIVARINFSDELPGQRIQIQSPGHIVNYSKNLIPLIVGAMLALSSSSACADSDFNDAKVPIVKVVNTVDDGALSDECTANVEKELYDDLKAMGYERWQEFCKLERDTRRRTKIDSGMSVKSKND